VIRQEREGWGLLGALTDGRPAAQRPAGRRIGPAGGGRRTGPAHRPGRGARDRSLHAQPVNGRLAAAAAGRATGEVGEVGSMQNGTGGGRMCPY
jgi:hypothetical protein